MGHVRAAEIPINTAVADGSGLEEAIGIVIFFFEQAGRYTRCEILPRSDGASELIVTAPEGGQTVEILSGSDVTRRISELQESLLGAGWWGPVGREF